MFNRLDRVPACDGRTDGRTDRRYCCRYYSTLHCMQCGRAVKTRNIHIAYHNSDDQLLPGDNVIAIHTALYLFFYSAASLLAMQRAVLATPIPSVRPSICLSHAGTLWFSDTNNGWGRHLIPLKICGQSDPPLSEKRRLRPISAYNVRNVRASEKVQLSRIGRRSRAFQRATDEVTTLPLTPPKADSKSEFVV